MQVPCELLELDAAQILELLRTHTFGRMVFAHESWPVILPVNYAFADPKIVIRTGPAQSWQALRSTPPLLKSTMRIRRAGWGWSVLVQGPAFEITLRGRDEHSRRLVWARR